MYIKLFVCVSSTIWPRLSTIPKLEKIRRSTQLPLQHIHRFNSNLKAWNLKKSSTIKIQNMTASAKNRNFRNLQVQIKIQQSTNVSMREAKKQKSDSFHKSFNYLRMSYVCSPLMLANYSVSGNPQSVPINSKTTLAFLYNLKNTSSTR